MLTASLLLASLLVACQGAGLPTPTATPAAPAATATVAPPSPTTAPATATVAPAGPTAATPSPGPASPSPGSPVAVAPTAAPPTATIPPTPPPVACTYGPTRRMAQLQTREIKEASALVASRRFPGVYWTLNDSGNDADIFAIDEQGASRGLFHVDNARNVDWETMQLGPDSAGGVGTSLYIGDVGDNDEERRESTIYRFPEPEPLPANTRNQEAKTARAEAFRIAFPNGPRNTEAMLVHPVTGEIVFITKDEHGHSEIYRAPTPLNARGTTTLQLVGKMDLEALGSRGELVTDASVSPDARHVVVRTYTSGLEYDLPDGAPQVSLWSQPPSTPRIFRLDDGGHGEGATYRIDGQSIVTIAEAEPTSLYVTPRNC